MINRKQSSSIVVLRLCQKILSILILIISIHHGCIFAVPEVMKKLVNGDTLLGLHYNCITCWINESFTMKFAKTHWSSFQLKKQVLYIRSFFKTIGLNKQFSLNKKSLAMSRKVAINKLTGKILVCYFENDFFQSQIYC